MKDDNDKIVLALMGEFLLEHLIEEFDKDRWRLTAAGKIEAEKAMAKLSHRDKALVILLASQIIGEG